MQNTVQNHLQILVQSFVQFYLQKPVQVLVQLFVQNRLQKNLRRCSTFADAESGAVTFADVCAVLRADFRAENGFACVILTR